MNRLLLFDLLSVYLRRPDVVDSINRTVLDYLVQDSSVNLVVTPLIVECHGLLSGCGDENTRLDHGVRWDRVFDEYLGDDPKKAISGVEFWIVNAMWRTHYNGCEERAARAPIFIGVAIDNLAIESSGFAENCACGWEVLSDRDIEAIEYDYVDLDPITSVARLLDEICGKQQHCETRYAFWTWWVGVVRRAIAMACIV